MGEEKQRRTLADVIGSRQFDVTVTLPDAGEIVFSMSPIGALAVDETERLHPMPVKPAEESEEWRRERDTVLGNRLAVLAAVSHAGTGDGRELFGEQGIAAGDTAGQVEFLKRHLGYQQLIELGLEVQKRSTVRRADVEEAKDELSPTESTAG